REETGAGKKNPLRSRRAPRSHNMGSSRSRQVHARLPQSFQNPRPQTAVLSALLVPQQSLQGLFETRELAALAEPGGTKSAPELPSRSARPSGPASAGLRPYWALSAGARSCMVTDRYAPPNLPVAAHFQLADPPSFPTPYHR